MFKSTQTGPVAGTTPQRAGRFTGAVVAALALVAISACGSDATSSVATSSVATSSVATSSVATGSSGSSSDGGTAALVDKAKKQVEELGRLDNVKLPTPPDSFSPGKHKLAIVTAGQAGGAKTMGDFSAQAAKAMGWDSQIFDGKYTAAGQAAALSQADTNGFDAVVMTAVNPSAVKAQIDALIAKGVPIACYECAQAGAQPFPQIIQVGDNGKTGELMQWVVIAETGGKGNVIVFDDKTFPIVDLRATSLIDGLKANCAQCKTKRVDTPTSDIGVPGPPAWSAALAADPTVTWGAGPYDALTKQMADTVTQLGIKAGVNGYDGDPAVIQEIGKGGPLKSTIGGAYEYLSWAGVDLVARALAHAKMWDASAMPTRIVTAANWKDFASGSWVPTGFSLQDTFAKSWGKK